MGVGIIIRDEEGEPLVVVCDQRNYVEDPAVAKYVALRKALEICSELNIHNAIFEGDARNVILAIQREEEDLSVLGPLIEDAKSFFRIYRDWQLQFAHREKNTVAHCLAKTALGLLEKMVWIEDTPAFVAKGLDFDRSCNTDYHQ
ncbi:uncharacterized protein LOC122301849 [Carya illinoinensis]|uniref:uncharacterized protein LOC122301849 n=1 Tax=Carya illinoinensis TaxID=32201 RepID=UPI001C726015|nr:uncharacterized protein LOC122301849 [Carya illinoinensis]